MTSRTDRKLDTPEETFYLNPHVVNQELGDEKVAEGLTDEVVGKESPILSNLPAKSHHRVMQVSLSAGCVSS